MILENIERQEVEKINYNSVILIYSHSSCSFTFYMQSVYCIVSNVFYIFPNSVSHLDPSLRPIFSKFYHWAHPELSPVSCLQKQPRRVCPHEEQSRLYQSAHCTPAHGLPHSEQKPNSLVHPSPPTQHGCPLTDFVASSPDILSLVYSTLTSSVSLQLQEHTGLVFATGPL